MFVKPSVNTVTSARVFLLPENPEEENLSQGVHGDAEAFSHSSIGCTRF
jgi:hypothetical protein